MESKTALIRVGQISGQTGVSVRVAGQIAKLILKHGLPAESHHDLVRITEEWKTNLATIDRALAMRFSLEEVENVLETRDYLRLENGATLSIPNFRELIDTFPGLDANHPESLAEVVDDMIRAYGDDEEYLGTIVKRVIRAAQAYNILDPVDAADFCRQSRQEVRSRREWS